MPRRINVASAGNEAFGKRLGRLRRAAGYSLRELGEEIGISKRMVAYYENETDQPPAALLPLLTRALGVSADELLGLQRARARARTVVRDSRLWRRFRQVEKLPPQKRRQVAQFIDTVLEAEQGKKKPAA